MNSKSCCLSIISHQKKRHITFDCRWSRKVSSDKQIIRGHILHLNTDLHFKTQDGVSVGKDFFSAKTLDFSVSHLISNSLLISTCLSFIAPASSSLNNRPDVTSMLKQSWKDSLPRSRTMQFTKITNTVNAIIPEIDI